MIAGSGMSRLEASGETGGQRLTLVLAAGYALGLAGAIWDDLEHADITGLGVGLAHLLIYLGIIVVLVTVILLLRSGAARAVNGAALWRRLAMGGLLVLITGFVVDIVWHGMNPDATETNMLLLPGHTIQHVGLAMGLAGAATEQWQLRLGQGR